MYFVVTCINKAAYTNFQRLSNGRNQARIQGMDQGDWSPPKI